MDFVSTCMEVVMANKLVLFFIYNPKVERELTEIGMKINIS